MKGLSVRNLKYCRFFYQFYSPQIGQQPVAQFGQLKGKNGFGVEGEESD